MTLQTKFFTWKRSFGTLFGLGRPMGFWEASASPSSRPKVVISPETFAKKGLVKLKKGRFARDCRTKRTLPDTKKPVSPETVAKNAPAETRKEAFRPRLSQISARLPSPRRPPARDCRRFPAPSKANFKPKISFSACRRCFARDCRRFRIAQASQRPTQKASPISSFFGR